MNNINETSGIKKTTHRIRPIIIGLTIAMLAGTGIAYASNNVWGNCEYKEGHDKKHNKQNMLSLSSKVVDQLQLNDIQKVVLTDAQNATQKMREEMRSAMRTIKESRKAEMKSDTFDPRAMFTQQDAMATQMLAARQDVQKQWLTFWDSLSDTQKMVVSNAIQSKKESHKHKEHS